MLRIEYKVIFNSFVTVNSKKIILMLCISLLFCQTESRLVNSILFFLESCKDSEEDLVLACYIT